MVLYNTMVRIWIIYNIEWLEGKKKMTLYKVILWWNWALSEKKFWEFWPPRMSIWDRLWLGPASGVICPAHVRLHRLSKKCDILHNNQHALKEESTHWQPGHLFTEEGKTGGWGWCWRRGIWPGWSRADGRSWPWWACPMVHWEHGRWWCWWYSMPGCR